jgi:RNA polymerase sigma factor (sigma-70 family)
MVSGSKDNNRPFDALASSTTGASGHFRTTHWSVVLRAGQSDSPAAQAALAQLCGGYWYPLYAFVRRQGYSPADAQDLTQGFFARLLEKRVLDEVDQTKGRFRSLLLASLKNFLANERDKALALKRGGGQAFIPIDTSQAESRFGLDPGHDLSADRIFERQWALTLLDKVLARLRAEHEEAGKTRLFAELKATLTGEDETPSYAEVARRLGMSETGVKVAVHRMRRRYRELLRAEIAQTVDGPGEVEAELRHLLAVLSR